MKKNVQFENGVCVSAIGQGTWYLGEKKEQWEQEVDSIRQGITQGMTVIDTAEMYGNGEAEKLVGEAISTVDHNTLFLVSKVLPSNAGAKRMRKALEGSLRRMKVDSLDLYLYHWRGQIPLFETVECFEKLKAERLIKAWGVSNFDIDDMEDLWEIPDGKNCLVNQVLYHMGSRGIEFSLLPWMEQHRVTLMSYCPLAQGGSLCKSIYDSDVIGKIAAAHDASVPQVLLAWNTRGGNTIAIPRSSRAEHTVANAGADEITLTQEEMTMIDAAFEPPKRKVYLDIQ